MEQKPRYFSRKPEEGSHTHQQHQQHHTTPHTPVMLGQWFERFISSVKQGCPLEVYGHQIAQRRQILWVSPTKQHTPLAVLARRNASTRWHYFLCIKARLSLLSWRPTVGELILVSPQRVSCGAVENWRAGWSQGLLWLIITHSLTYLFLNSEEVLYFLFPDI